MHNFKNNKSFKAKIFLKKQKLKDELTDTSKQMVTEEIEPRPHSMAPQKMNTISMR
jgi:hypothetical protein